MMCYQKFIKTVVCIGLLLVSSAFWTDTGHSLSLDQAVRQALEYNPGLQKQQLGQKLTQYALDEKKSQNFGKFDLTASYSHYNLPRTLAPLTPASIFGDPTAVPTTQDLFTTGIMYEVPLFTGFAQQRAVEVAALEKEMAAASLTLSREQLIYNVKTLYMQILSLKAQETAQDEYFTALQHLYEEISLEVKLGRKARVDQLKAAADMENARVKSEQLAGNIRILKASLAALLNIETLPLLEDTPLVLPTKKKIEYIGDIEDLDRYRSSVLAEEKSGVLVEKSSSSYYPQVAFNGYYGQNFGPNDSSHTDEGDWNNEEVWQAAVNLKWSVFDFGSRKAAKEMAIIRRQQSRRDRMTTELELQKSLREAVTKIEIALSEYYSAETELALTRETENIEQTRFAKGAADLNDLLYAKARNQLALSRSITAKYNYQTGMYYLDYLLENGENK